MLDGKQKRYLRALANSKKAIVTIGKDNITNTVIQALDDALEAHELVKISILKSCILDINEIEIELIKDTKCDLVQQIGRTLVLYRPSKEKKIILP